MFVIAPEMASKAALAAATEAGGPGREVLTTWMDDLLQVRGEGEGKGGREGGREGEPGAVLKAHCLL